MFVYFTVLLSAMQVALATQKLGSNIGFQNFSRVIALILIAFVLWAVATMLIVWSFLFCFHVIQLFNTRRRSNRRGQALLGLELSRHNYESHMMHWRSLLMLPFSMELRIIA